jgi:hypothetical protein
MRPSRLFHQVLRRVQLCGHGATQQIGAPLDDVPIRSRILEPTAVVEHAADHILEYILHLPSFLVECCQQMLGEQTITANWIVIRCLARPCSV